MSGSVNGYPASPLVSNVGSRDLSPLAWSHVENRSPIRVNSATACVLCPVRTSLTPPANRPATSVTYRRV